ncbi:MAG: hypothetical protein AB7R77_17015 [Ilumatobacteraceae bacterium]
MSRSLLVVIAMAGLTLSGALAACGDSTNRTPKVVEIVVPAGTQDRLDRGETVDVMPAKLEFRVGDTLRIRNDDRADQYVGPYFVVAGDQFELTFGSAGRYEGLCNLSGGASYEIVISR